MNGQQQIKKEWVDVVKDLDTMINNTEITLVLLNAQLEEAKAHIKSK